MDMNMKKILTCALIACSVAAVTSCEDSDDIWNVKLQTVQLPIPLRLILPMVMKLHFKERGIPKQIGS